MPYITVYANNKIKLGTMIQKSDDQIFYDGEIPNYNYLVMENGVLIKDPEKVAEDLINDSATEKEWRNEELDSTLNRIDQYEKDLNYDEEYKTSPLTSEEYYALLKYRKLLCDYTETSDYPYGERPTV